MKIFKKYNKFMILCSIVIALLAGGTYTVTKVFMENDSKEYNKSNEVTNNEKDKENKDSEKSENIKDNNNQSKNNNSDNKKEQDNNNNRSSRSNPTSQKNDNITNNKNDSSNSNNNNQNNNQKEEPKEDVNISSIDPNAKPEYKVIKSMTYNGAVNQFISLYGNNFQNAPSNHPDYYIYQFKMRDKTVLVATLTKRNNGCYSLDFSSMSGTISSSTFNLRERVPTAGATCTQVITTPTVIIIVDNAISAKISITRASKQVKNYKSRTP